MDNPNYVPAAYPTHHHGQDEGMSLRDYFAAKAMQGLIGETSEMMMEIATSAYQQADAMLAERAK